MTARSPLKGKVVVITGASRGLGAALARAFAAEGCKLVLGARTMPELEAVAAETGAMAVQTDVREPGELQALVDAAVGEHGRLDIMINNAGLAIYGPFESVSPEQLDLLWQTNVRGAYFGSQAAFRVMKQQRSGLIVNISSVAGKWHLPNESAYNATKWAVNGFTGTLRLEAEPHGVKVTAVCPGGIDTPFWKAMDYYPFPQDRIDPERDFMKPEQVAETVVHVARGADTYVVPEVVMLPLISQR
ncbi:MAG: SDR family oxidoreductase [Alphaproteobacteria bacterium]|nr:SDR family oxidoreductase [Alphaproteobacteria bacterium]